MLRAGGGSRPCGAELGRCLAQAGVDVCVIDRLPDLQRAAFSSAAMPMAAVQEFGLPAQVVGARWTAGTCWDPAASGALGSSRSLWGWCWILRPASLAHEQLQAWGGRLQLGWTALASEPAADGGVITHCRDANGAKRSIHSDWLIDATGQQRA